MMMLYVLLVSGSLQIQTLDVSLADQGCLLVAQELRKSSKVEDAFCLISDPDTREDEERAKIGRYPKDGEASN